MVPLVEGQGCRPVRGRLRSRALDLRNCRIGSWSRPLAPDRSANCRTAGDAECEARVRALGNGPGDATVEAEVSLRLRLAPTPFMQCAPLAAPFAWPSRAPGTGDRRCRKCKLRELDHRDGCERSRTNSAKGREGAEAKAPAGPASGTSWAGASGSTAASTSAATAASAAPSTSSTSAAASISAAAASTTSAPSTSAASSTSLALALLIECRSLSTGELAPLCAVEPLQPASTGESAARPELGRDHRSHPHDLLALHRQHDGRDPAHDGLRTPHLLVRSRRPALHDPLHALLGHLLGRGDAAAPPAGRARPAVHDV